MEWQPIETAPKDGTHILAWDGAVQVVVMWGTREKELLLIESENGPHEECPTEWIATHWLPLPLPPTK